MNIRAYESLYCALYTLRANYSVLHGLEALVKTSSLVHIQASPACRVSKGLPAVPPAGPFGGSSIP